jgi:hypothetical protein
MTAVFDKSGSLDLNATFYTLKADTPTKNLFQNFFSSANLTQVCIINVSLLINNYFDLRVILFNSI